MSYNPKKCDPVLGSKVHSHLLGLGLETPITDKVHDDHNIKITRITKNFTDIMEVLGLDLSDDSLADTPHRVAKMFVNEIFWGLDWDKFPKCTMIKNKMQYNEMVVERNITLYSDCEHHFRPIVGTASVAYIPKKTVLGLSKMPRICEYFSRRPQVQERLTEQIFHTLSYILDTDDVAVTINAKHLCVSQRGVEDSSADTFTSRVGGVFKNDPLTRTEFMAITRQ